jgi:apolipoprotein N-acyltransferase
LRATNTGVTAAIDPQGRITASMPRHIRGTLAVGFNYIDSVTFYTQHGDWIAWLCAIVAVLVTALGHAPRRAVN